MNLSNEIIIGIATAITTMLVTLIISYLTHKMATKKMLLQLNAEYNHQEKIFLRNKLEELYSLIDKWASSFGSYHIPLMSVMKDEITYDEALDYYISSEKDSKYDFKQIELMINLYFDGLKKQYAALIAKRGVIQTIIDKHKNQYKQGDLDGEKYLKPFVESQLIFHKGIGEFKEDIVVYSKALFIKSVV